MKIPAQNPDLRRYVRARYIKLFTALILWNALLAWLEYIFIYDYFITTLNELNAVITWIFLSILPFFLLRGHKLIFDSSWEGTLTAVTYESKNDLGRDSAAMVAETREPDLKATLHVQLDSGKTVNFVFNRLQNAEGFPYLPGQRVRHYRGTRFPLILDDEHELCVICGANNGKDAEVCAYCGRTLVKPR